MRTATVTRKTAETTVTASLNLDGNGTSQILVPIGFFGHMLAAFAKHGLFDLTLTAQGDLEVDQHHLIEDCGIVLGSLFDQALGGRTGINRSGCFVFPMDEALATAAIDIAGRPYLQFEMTLKRRFCGDFDTDLLEDFFQGFAASLKANLVVRMPYGRSDHHKIEAAFKAFGRALREACTLETRLFGHIASTKGVL